MGKLLDRANELSPWVRLEDKESFTGIYKGWREVVSNFDPKKTLFQYEFEKDGVTKFWKSGNMGHAKFFDGIEKETVVIITRHGVEKNTTYDVVLA